MSGKVSRRNFLAGTAVVGIGALHGNLTTDVFAQNKVFDNHPLFSRNDPALYDRVGEFPHGGPGRIAYMELTPRDRLQSQFLFVHRGKLEPKCGLGEHVHRRMEEMYIIFDGAAQFTVNGRTATLPGPAMTPCVMGSSHGIYNHTEKPVEFMNIGVTYADRKYDALDFGKKNDLVDAIIESPPPFPWTVFDKRLLTSVPSFYNGKGNMLTRVVWPTEIFRTNWGFVNHYVLTPGSSVGYHRHDVMEEVYYILSGTGRMTVDDATYNVKAGDAATVVLHGAHGLYNNSDKDLELISIAVALEKGKYDGTSLGDDLTKR
ncbi:MAG: cupin domain-containing protein [Candidatus Latescibacteria bacterium]|nr:cupin domain-containing protein [Candidatus Latescibacterota bacterium]